MGVLNVTGKTRKIKSQKDLLTNSPQDSTNSCLKSGKYVLSYKSTLKALRSGKAKLAIIAGNHVCDGGSEPLGKKDRADRLGMQFEGNTRPLWKSELDACQAQRPLLCWQQCMAVSHPPFF